MASRSGSSVSGDVGVFGSVEGYARAADVPMLIDQYGLETSRASEGNVSLRIVNDVWPFDEDESVAPALVVALDLLESTDARTSRAGRQLLNQTLRKSGADGR